MTNHPSDADLEKAIDNLKAAIEAAENGNSAGEQAVWKAHLALHPSQDTNNLIEAFVPILELAKRKADYPADLGMVTRADEALTRAKGQSND